MHIAAAAKPATASGPVTPALITARTLAAPAIATPAPPVLRRLRSVRRRGVICELTIPTMPTRVASQPAARDAFTTPYRTTAQLAIVMIIDRADDVSFRLGEGCILPMRRMML